MEESAWGIMNRLSKGFGQVNRPSHTAPTATSKSRSLFHGAGRSSFDGGGLLGRGADAVDNVGRAPTRQLARGRAGWSGGAAFFAAFGT
eukprot:880510-Prymnesium_polylepis.1